MEEVFSVPNIKSAKKRVLLTKVNTERNKAAKSALKTTIKKFDAAVVAGNRDEAAVAYTNAVKAIDKAVNKGILHKNTAARKKSSITLKMNAMA
jgi:small subunit ribosomal protein S20